MPFVFPSIVMPNQFTSDISSLYTALSSISEAINPAAFKKSSELYLGSGDLQISCFVTSEWAGSVNLLSNSCIYSNCFSLSCTFSELSLSVIDLILLFVKNPLIRGNASDDNSLFFG